MNFDNKSYIKEEMGEAEEEAAFEQPLLGGGTSAKVKVKNSKRTKKERDCWKVFWVVILGGVVILGVLAAIFIFLYRKRHSSNPSSQPSLSLPPTTSSLFTPNSIPFLNLSLFAPPPRPLPSSSNPFGDLPSDWPGHLWLSEETVYTTIIPNVTFPPEEYLEASYAFMARSVVGNSAFNSTTGRPLMVPRSSLVLSHEGWIPPSLNVSSLLTGGGHTMPKVQWDGFQTQTGFDEDSQQRREWVKRAFLHAWNGYKRNAWGHDQVNPESSTHTDPYNGWGATIVDAMDTLLIMNLSFEYDYAREHVRAIDFTYPFDTTCFSMLLPTLTAGNLSGGTLSASDCQNPSQISLFETTIRYLGGLLSAYGLSGDPLMLSRAIELGNWLLPAMGTSSGLPIDGYTIGFNPNGTSAGQNVLAQAGSLSMEFTRLSMESGDQGFFQAISRITDVLNGSFVTETESNGTRLGTLLPAIIDSDNPEAVNGSYTFGADCDSYYEYLIKMHQLTRGSLPEYSEMYTQAIKSAQKYLIKPVTVVPGWENMTIIGETTSNNGTDQSWAATMEHLTCFSGGMFALGSKLLGREDDMAIAETITNACNWAYEGFASGVGPEYTTFYQHTDAAGYSIVNILVDEVETLWIAPTGSPLGVSTYDGASIGRPETIESTFYMYRITGDRYWQDRGWKMFTSWVAATIAPSGFVGLDDVNTVNGTTSDSMQSFVFAETFKYYYLLFSPEDFISLDEYVFNTESHPLRFALSSSPSLWTTANNTEDSNSVDFVGQGSYVQQWSRIQQAAATD